MIQKIGIIIIDTFLEDIYQKSALIGILIFLFYIFHLKNQPLITEKLNKLNIWCDYSFLFFILIKIFSHNTIRNSNLYYFTLVLASLIKLVTIATIMRWILKIVIYSNKMVIQKFKTFEPYLKNICISKFSYIY